MDERMIRFLKKHHVLTLATVGTDGMPHCSNLFYAWLEAEQAFVFTSSPDTKHAQDALQQPEVAASVVLETRVVGNVQGVQLRGRMFRPEGELLRTAKTRYLHRFPYAAAMGLEPWLLEVDRAKMSDNTLGFGKKLLWERKQP